MREILLVDDESDVLSMMADVLGDEGFTTHAVADGEEALRLLQQRRFGVVVSDIMMPRINGLRLLEAIKRLDASVPVILVTGFATRELSEDALRKGAVRVLEKPFTGDQFVAAIREALGDDG
jgi:DNA-binding NtrC family response regulator